MKTQVRERPILLNPHEVRAILDGGTRLLRPLKPQPAHVWGYGVSLDSHDFTAHVRYPGGQQPDPWVRCPYGAPPHRGQPGDRLWVRETWGSADRYYQSHENDTPSVVAYAADKQAMRWDAATPQAVPDWDLVQWNWSMMEWRPSVHMPRWAARIVLEIEAIRVVQEARAWAWAIVVRRVS